MTPARMADIHAAAFHHGRPWRAVEFDQLLANPNVHAVTDTPGFALIQVAAPEAELLTISVLPDHQGQGHGARLLSAACTMAQDMGATSLFLEVHRDNAPARALYARAGFAETGLRRAYYRNPDGTMADAILLRLQMTACD